jgi:PAS domain S-box-containing protein
MDKEKKVTGGKAEIAKKAIPVDATDALQRFAAHIHTRCLDEFILKEIDIFRSSNIPMLAYIDHLSDAEQFEIAKRSGLRFLRALEEDTYGELIMDNFKRWDNNQIKFISKEHVSLEDILLINSGQKLALFHFIPEFTKEPTETIQIVTKLENIYRKAQVSAVAMLEQSRKQQEQRYIESEARYRDLFDNASDMIHIVTPEGKILYVNNAWKRTLGYSEAELEGESIYFYVCSRDRERFRNYRNNVLEKGVADDPLMISFMSKDNREIITEGVVSARMKDGKAEYTRGIFRDVTRRVQNEEKLQYYTQEVLEREEKIKQLIQNAPDAIIVINEEGNINVWNPKAEQIFGWKADEVLGSLLSDAIIPEQYREAHTQGMKRLLATGEARVLNKTIEVTARRKDASEFYVSLTISRATLPQGSLFIAFLRDISADKQKEIELEQHRVELERTNSELEQYAWVASHDLKEPLRKIRTFSDLLLTQATDQLPAEMTNRIRKISESAERMDELIEAILLYSHSSADQAFVDVDLNEVLQEVLADLEVTISNTNGIVQAGQLPVVSGIRFQLRQLFQNLIGNGLKYHRAGVNPVINISCTKEKDTYRITVQDNGIGFKTEFVGKIFQVFQRLVPRTEYEGTGIGLALCKKIVENHGGSIEATSEEGRGSSFQVVLPVISSA